MSVHLGALGKGLYVMVMGTVSMGARAAELFRVGGRPARDISEIGLPNKPGMYKKAKR
jgi:hypothetical protein